jgi:NADH-quinone oxidoreductase subunit E
LDKVQEIALRFKDLPGGLIEALHAVQAEYAYIPEDVLDRLAGAFQIPRARVYGVAKFYSYFSVKPRGRFIIRICKSAPCHVQGAAEVVQALEDELGIRLGETTEDKQFTLEPTECVGACEQTPVITINGKPYGDLNPTKVKDILAGYKQQQ